MIHFFLPNLRIKFSFGNLIAVLFLSLILSLGACKTSGDIRDQGGITSDPNQIRTLEAPPGREGALSLPEGMQRKVDELESRNEELTFRIQQMTINYEQQIALLREENEKIKNQLVSVASGSVAPRESQNASSATQELWTLALEAMKEQDTQKAMSSVKTLYTTYPKHARAYGALLLGGFIEFKNKNYREATLAFNMAMERFPNARHGISLIEFGLAASVYKMGRREDAKLFFEEVQRKYPQSAAGRLAGQIAMSKAQVPDDLFVTFPNWLDFINR